jgi:hypothetical protein
MTSPDTGFDAQTIVYLRDVDGTGSMHPCAKGDPGAVEFVSVAQTPRPYFDADLVNRQCKLGDYCKCCAGKPRLCPNYEGPGAVSSTSGNAQQPRPPVPSADSGVREESDPVLMRCPHCQRVMWAERNALPNSESANTIIGTWLRCGYPDCNKPFDPPSNPSRTLASSGIAGTLDPVTVEALAKRLDCYAYNFDVDHAEHVIVDLKDAAKYLRALIGQPAPSGNDRAVHLSHCNQGEYLGSCKYGDDDCPAFAPAGCASNPVTSKGRDLSESNFCAGLTLGWNLGLSEDRERFDAALKAHSPVTSTHQSAPALTATHNSGEGDPAVTPDCAGAGTSTDRDEIISAREDERARCADLAMQFNDCGGDFIAEKIRDRAVPHTEPPQCTCQPLGPTLHRSWCALALQDRIDR